MLSVPFPHPCPPCPPCPPGGGAGTGQGQGPGQGRSPALQLPAPRVVFPSASNWIAVISALPKAAGGGGDGRGRRGEAVGGSRLRRRGRSAAHKARRERGHAVRARRGTDSPGALRGTEGHCPGSRYPSRARSRPQLGCPAPAAPLGSGFPPSHPAAPAPGQAKRLPWCGFFPDAEVHQFPVSVFNPLCHPLGNARAGFLSKYSCLSWQGTVKLLGIHTVLRYGDYKGCSTQNHFGL